MCVCVCVRESWDRTVGILQQRREQSSEYSVVTDDDLEDVLERLEKCDGNDEIIQAICGDQDTAVSEIVK